MTSCRGFHAGFCPTLGGLSLDMNVSTTMIFTPGPVIDFLLANQSARDPRNADWTKARRMLKNMRVKMKQNNREFKIIGLSEKPCNQQFFPLKVTNSDGGRDRGTLEITVNGYFTEQCNIELKYYAYMPCLDVGRPKRTSYLPLELCSLVSLLCYTKALSSVQRASVIEKSRQKPRERTRVVTDAVKNYGYDDDPLILSPTAFPLSSGSNLYAHLAVTQMGQFIKFEDFSETSSGHKSLTSHNSRTCYCCS